MEQRYKMYLTKNQFNNLAHYLKGHKEFALYDKIMRYATLVYLNQESRLCIGFFADELRKIAFMFCDELPESEETDYFEECAASSLEWKKQRMEARIQGTTALKNESVQTLF